MKVKLYGALALMMAMALAPVFAQDKTSLVNDRDKASYMVGMDVARSLAPAAADIDLAAFERAVRNGMDGGKPLIDEKQASATGQALMQRIAMRNGQPIPGMAPGSEPPQIDKAKVGLLLGADVGRGLQPIKDDIDLATTMQALRTVLGNGKPLLSDADAAAIGQAFGQRVTAKRQAEATAQGAKNAAAGKAFLAANKQVKGVFTTPSGLQYMVLRQGSGPRPLPGAKVRVTYRGTLLDGTQFDSSDEHGGPAEFSLDQVIAGWTEGVAMMPVGAKYRFWIPGDLAYGEKGSQGIGPNSTLVFDVELLGIL